MNGYSDNRDPKSNRLGSFPIVYPITLTTNGTWLHGDQRGSIDPHHNEFQTPLLSPNRSRAKWEQCHASNERVILNDRMQMTTANTIAEVARHHGWTIHALNVRTNHVHIVINGAESPERMMNSMKSWCTRRMKEHGLTEDQRRVWTRHGSTRYLWDEISAAAACQYVREEQGGNLAGSMIDSE